ncbi:MAG: polysaccharide deacetylase family protein [Phycisphaerae bacterium]|nr:polysaccharide deacetylase family protein [Gemmatimonadaceae bacterium]
MRLVVSIHDVSPAWTSSVVALWTLCQQYDVAPALLVVPDWHGQWPLRRHASFTTWLHSCVSDGAEVLLHGERHDEVGSKRGLRDEVRAFGRTAGEGEFLTLGQAAASERIARGLDLLHELGFAPVGFVPPAWLARDDTLLAVRDAGLRISEDSHSIYVHERNERLAAPAVRWSGRTNARAHTSAFVASVRWRMQRDSSLLRLALHPQDLENPVTSTSVHRELNRWLSLRSVVRYADL